LGIRVSPSFVFRHSSFYRQRFASGVGFVIFLARVNILINVLLAIWLLIALLMVLVILMQRPKSEGLGAAFGGAVTENIFGAQTTNVLVKFTAWLAGIFFVLTFTLSILYANRSVGGNTALRRELMKKQAAAQASPAVPASPAPPTSQSSPAASPAPDSGVGVLPAGSAPPVTSPAASAPPVASPAAGVSTAPAAAPSPTASPDQNP
jgi:preprotein translocase subunit SecG